MSEPKAYTRPPWWPETPYPERIFPMTTEDYVAAVPDEKLRTAITGCIARWAWGVASDMILKAYQDEKEAMDS